MESGFNGAFAACLDEKERRRKLVVTAVVFYHAWCTPRRASVVCSLVLPTETVQWRKCLFFVTAPTGAAVLFTVEPPLLFARLTSCVYQSTTSCLVLLFRPSVGNCDVGAAHCHAMCWHSAPSQQLLYCWMYIRIKVISFIHGCTPTVLAFAFVTKAVMRSQQQILLA